MTGAAANPAVSGGAGASALPRHIGIIMDGNGRWAKKRMLPRVAGHRQGAEAVRKTLRAAAEMGIQVLTLYAFSSENWRRPATEIADLMSLLRRYILAELDEIAREGIRIRIIGDISRFEPDLVTMLEEACARTEANERMTFVLALNYGAQDELVRAARALIVDGIAPEAVDHEAIEQRLDTRGLPPLDLLIRTSGEKRLSNFMLWQAAYAELWFTDMLWPDFDGAELARAVDEFSRRERRYGGL